MLTNVTKTNLHMCLPAEEINLKQSNIDTALSDCSTRVFQPGSAAMKGDEHLTLRLIYFETLRLAVKFAPLFIIGYFNF